MSDSHGSVNNMLKVIDAELPDVILHLGDCINDCKDFGALYPDIMIRTVRGNCDRAYKGLDIDEFMLEGKRFMITHGHMFSVKMGKHDIKRAAIERGADILLFGHTHVQYGTNVDGMTVLNPGSINIGTNNYAIIEINNGVIECELKSL